MGLIISLSVVIFLLLLLRVCCRLRPYDHPLGSTELEGGAKRFPAGEGSFQAQIYGRCIRPQKAGAPRGVLVLTHGIHQSSEMYTPQSGHTPFVSELLDIGFAVYLFDLRGFGRSSNPHGKGATVPDFSRGYMADLRAAIQEAERELPGVPVFVFGHSLGGLTVTLLATSSDPPACVAGYVLSAPSISHDPNMPRFATHCLVPALARLAPGLGIPFFNPEQVTNNKGFLEAWKQASPDFTLKLSYAKAGSVAIDKCVENYQRFQKPVLLLTGPGSKRSDASVMPGAVNYDMFNHDGTKHLADAMTAAGNGDLVTFRLVPNAPHELVFEPNPDPKEIPIAVREAVRWLDLQASQHHATPENVTVEHD